MFIRWSIGGSIGVSVGGHVAIQVLEERGHRESYSTIQALEGRPFQLEAGRHVAERNTDRRVDDLWRVYSGYDGLLGVKYRRRGR